MFAHSDFQVLWTPAKEAYNKTNAMHMRLRVLFIDAAYLQSQSIFVKSRGVKEWNPQSIMKPQNKKCLIVQAEVATPNGPLKEINRRVRKIKQRNGKSHTVRRQYIPSEVVPLPPGRGGAMLLPRTSLPHARACDHPTQNWTLFPCDSCQFRTTTCRRCNTTY